MASLHFTTYPGLGEWAKDNLHYSQAVRIGNVIKIAGQGGWNPSPDISSPATWISSDIDAEIDQAFANVELALKAAGGKGWSQVYSIRSYHVPLDTESTSAMVRNFKQWCGPEHRPIWTHMGVTGLGLDTMRVEIEVEALVE